MVCTLRRRRGRKMERSALHLSILSHAAVYRQMFFYSRLNSCTVLSHFRIKSTSVNKCRCTSSIAFLRVVPSHCEWLHGGHPSRPLHEQHRVASGRETETRWSRYETWCTDHESMISCNLENPTKPPKHCRKLLTLPSLT